MGDCLLFYTNLFGPCFENAKYKYTTIRQLSNQLMILSILKKVYWFWKNENSFAFRELENCFVLTLRIFKLRSYKAER